jgi:endogenous inhibitor of DNA gyrase (YacG/DUF329 family)
MPDTTSAGRTETIVPCPVCRKITRYHPDNPYRPFCSERCRLVDLGQWFEEGYRVAGESAVPDHSDEESSFDESE